MTESDPHQLTDQLTDSGHRVTRTYGRTHGDGLLQMRDRGGESNARETETEPSAGDVGKAIGAIVWGRSPRYAEVNGAKVISARDLPESILTALAALVDAVQTEFGDVEERRRAAEADEPRPLCPWHAGQLAEFCSPCRSERIGAA